MMTGLRDKSIRAWGAEAEGYVVKAQECANLSVVEVRAEMIMMLGKRWNM